MSLFRETNPYFARPQNEDQHSQLPSSGVGTRQPRSQSQQNQPPVPWSSRPQTQDQHSQPPRSPRLTQPLGQDQHSQPSLSPWFTQPQPQPHGQDHHSRVPSSPGQRAKKPKRHDRRNQPLGAWTMLPESQDQRVQPPQRQGELSGPQVTSPLKQQPQQPQPQGSQATQPKHQGEQLQPESPEHQDHHRRRRRHQSDGPRVPSPRRTKLLTWFLAWFCAIFWVVIILGGLIVLIVYLLYRPHNPRFDASSVTLNAAYLDVGVLLNADLTVLANFTNPNKKVRVDFSYVVLDLYYGKTVIASQYVEPFSAARATSWLTNVRMIASQVRLPVAERERLKKEIDSNAVVFQVKGVFRARSDLGSFLRYSYWLYSHCTIVMTGPPSGVTRASRCKTKR